MKPAVLVIDDSLTVRMDLGEAFTAAGFAPTLAASAAEARAALRRLPFALIVLDVVLPDADGVELLRELKAAPETAAVPVMLLSTEADVRDRIRGLKTGADDYVGKPYQQSWVVARARELVRDPAASSSSPAGPPTILVIDDSATFRVAMRAVLEAAGYVIVLAGSGEEGLRTAVNLRPAAMLVDCVLPGIDGPTVIRRLRGDALLRGTPCILMTASEGAIGEIGALDAGADAYVRKDAGPDVILARLAAVLRSARQTASPTLHSSLLGPKKILAVDNNLAYLRKLDEALRRDGYDVVTARSSAEAHQLLAVQRVDCILLDQEQGGEDTCRSLKAAPELRDVPLILHSDRGDRGAIIAAIHAGADDFVTKARDFDVLRARLQAQLRRKHLEDENRSAREARAVAELSELRAKLLAELERKNRDLSRAKAELEEKNLRIEVANRLKSRFLANMSHELRTPLNAIIGFAQLLFDGAVAPDSPEQKEFLGDILTSARHLLDLINDVLDLSKVEAGRLEFYPEVADVGAIVDEVVSVVRSTAAEKGVRLEADVADLGFVTVDTSRLKQVLYNYASNAIKFSPAGATVWVRVRADGDAKFRIEVQDSGPGIAADDIGQLFVEFHQLDGTKPGGTGLGLALTKRLVEAQGGSVGLTTEVGRGSVFFAVLPRQASDAAGLPPPRELPGPTPDAPLVLVVEDNAHDQEVVVRSLQDSGYAVEAVATCADAAVRLRDRSYAAVVLDLVLPDGPGLRVVDAARTSVRNARVPIVVVSVVADAAAGVPVHDALGKPLDADRLRASLRSAGVVPGKEGAILVVDDDDSSRNYMEAMLAQLGYQTAAAADGASALAAAAAQRPLAIVLDLVMPGMDGMVFVQRFREEPTNRNVPVIIWTARDLSPDEQHRLRASTQAVVRKGEGGTEELIAALRGADG